MSIKRHALKTLRRNDNGNVAMVFALTLIPLLLVAGFAIDAQLAFSKKGKIQHAIDSAVLAGARMMQNTNDENAVKEHARHYFAAIMSTEFNELTCDTLDIIFSGPEELTGEVSCYQPTTIMNLIGKDTMEIHSSSVATFGTGRVDVAFVFDISGSMNSYSRLYNLKIAAKDAADTLLPRPGSASDGDVRIAMAAYNNMVNAGQYFENVTGIKRNRKYQGQQSYWETETTTEYGWHETCEAYCRWSWGPYCLSWGERCESEYGPHEVEREVEKFRTVEYSMNSTCVYERGGDHAFDNKQPTQLQTYDLENRPESGAYNAQDSNSNTDAFLAGAFATYNGSSWNTTGTSCRSAEPFALSHNKTQINKFIDDLSAGDGTAGHQGIAWGWYLISEEWSDVFTGNATPLSQSEPDVTKAMIIMTDGEFNQQFFNSQGNSFNQAESLCDEIKEDDVIIYTVAFQAPNAGKEILQKCASGPEFYFNAENGQELVESYNAIATSISDLRISH